MTNHPRNVSYVILLILENYIYIPSSYNDNFGKFELHQNISTSQSYFILFSSKWHLKISNMYFTSYANSMKNSVSFQVNRLESSEMNFHDQDHRCLSWKSPILPLHISSFFPIILKWYWLRVCSHLDKEFKVVTLKPLIKQCKSRQWR